MATFDFYNLENIDGYFSGVIFIYAEQERYIVEFGYDIEFKQLKLMNCNDFLYNSDGISYDSDMIKRLEVQYSGLIIEEIQFRLSYT